MVVDPWGTVIAQCHDKSPDICFAEIDLDYVKSVRQQLPCFEHRRNDVYQLNSSRKFVTKNKLYSNPELTYIPYSMNIEKYIGLTISFLTVISTDYQFSAFLLFQQLTSKKMIILLYQGNCISLAM